MPDLKPLYCLFHVRSCIITHTWTNLLEWLWLLLLHFICCYDGLVIGVCKRTEPAREMTTPSGFPSTWALNAPESVMTFRSVTRFQDRNYKPNDPSVWSVPPPPPQVPQAGIIHPFQPTNMPCRYIMFKKYRERLNKHTAKPDSYFLIFFQCISCLMTLYCLNVGTVMQSASKSANKYWPVTSYHLTAQLATNQNPTHFIK